LANYRNPDGFLRLGEQAMAGRYSLWLCDDPDGGGHARLVLLFRPRLDPGLLIAPGAGAVAVLQGLTRHGQPAASARQPPLRLTIL
jgi:hypothetical protein